MRRFWICHVAGTDGGTHFQHYSPEGAENEAERLARLTGKEVYFFECLGKCKIEKEPIRWELPR